MTFFTGQVGPLSPGVDIEPRLGPSVVFGVKRDRRRLSPPLTLGVEVGDPESVLHRSRGVSPPARGPEHNVYPDRSATRPRSGGPL